MGTVALDYAGRGWPVLPLRGKIPITPHGVHDATTDEATILRWWTAHPGANIGIACGRISGLVVIDVDPRNGGDETIAELEQRHGHLPATPKALTGRGDGGRHLYYRYPSAPPPRWPKTLGPGVDLQADDRYVVAPPSRHPDTGGSTPGSRLPTSTSWPRAICRRGSWAAGRRRPRRATIPPSRSEMESETPP